MSLQSNKMSNTDCWETKSLLSFVSPCTIMITGSTMTGKTKLTCRILKHAAGMFNICPKNIVFAYSEYQSLFDDIDKDIPSLILHKGLPTRDEIEEWSEHSDHTVLVLDDLIDDVVKSKDSLHLFQVAAHHKCVTVILLTQNFFMPGKYARSISFQCQYLIALKIFVH